MKLFVSLVVLAAVAWNVIGLVPVWQSVAAALPH